MNTEGAIEGVRINGIRENESALFSQGFMIKQTVRNNGMSVFSE